MMEGSEESSGRAEEAEGRVTENLLMGEKMSSDFLTWTPAGP